MLGGFWVVCVSLGDVLVMLDGVVIVLCGMFGIVLVDLDCIMKI